MMYDVFGKQSLSKQLLFPNCLVSNASYKLEKVLANKRFKGVNIVSLGPSTALSST